MEQQQMMLKIYILLDLQYSVTAGSLCFYSKDEATDFNADIANDNNFKSFKYKAKLLGNTVAQADNAANEIFKNETMAVLLKHLSNFWRSLEVPLIICKVELKRKWLNYCVLPAAGNDNANNGNDDNIIFTIRDAK